MTAAAGYVVQLSAAAPGDRGHPLTDVPAESADRAVALIRFQARPFAMALPEDHPLWEWLEHGWPATRRTLQQGQEVRLSFTVGDSQIAWTVRPLSPADGDDDVLLEPSRRLEPLIAVRCEQDAAEGQPLQSTAARVESASAAVRWIHRHLSALVAHMDAAEAQQVRQWLAGHDARTAAEGCLRAGEPLVIEWHAGGSPIVVSATP